MEQLPVIPTPKAVRDREFRIKTVPIIVFAVVILLLIIIGWSYISAPTIVGEVEPVTSYVSSPKTGIVYLQNIAPLQQVKAGDPIAQVVTTDPKVLASTLALIRAETRLLQMNLEPLASQQRYVLQYDRLRLDWLSQRVDLASTKVKLQLAEKDLQRTEALSKGKIVADLIFDKAKSDRDKLQAEVDERTRLVAELEKSFGEMRLEGDTPNSSITPATPRQILDAAIAVQEEKIRLAEAELSPLILRSPVDGTINLVNHQSGETVVEGQPIVTISALSSDHIRGFVRQPIAIEVAVGMPVEIHARSMNHAIGHGKILSVGSQMEIINPLILPGPLANIPTSGLPVKISLPPGLKLHPGEIVDLALR